MITKTEAIEGLAHAAWCFAAVQCSLRHKGGSKVALNPQPSTLSKAFAMIALQAHAESVIVGYEILKVWLP